MKYQQPTMEQLQNFPQQLRNQPVWLPWIARSRPNGGIAKIPTQVESGYLHPTDALRGGVPLSKAHDVMLRYGGHGVGIVVTPDLGWVCLDLDGPGEAWQDALLVLLAPLGYCEHSPSGTGRHLWLPVKGVKNQYRGAIELLCRGFVTVTGQIWTPGNALPSVSPGETIPNQAIADDELLRRIARARNAERYHKLFEGDWSGYGSPSEADFSLARLLRYWTRDPEQLRRLMLRSKLKRPKWGRRDYLDRTITNAIRLGGPVWSGGLLRPP